MNKRGNAIIAALGISTLLGITAASIRAITSKAALHSLRAQSEEGRYYLGEMAALYIHDCLKVGNNAGNCARLADAAVIPENLEARLDWLANNTALSLEGQPAPSPSPTPSPSPSPSPCPSPVCIKTVKGKCTQYSTVTCTNSPTSSPTASPSPSPSNIPHDTRLPAPLSVTAQYDQGRAAFAGFRGNNASYSATGNRYCGTLDFASFVPDKQICVVEVDVKQRMVILPIDTTTNKNPFKVVLIIDNSSSMSDNQANLAIATFSMLDKLKGLDADLFVYTTSNQVSKIKSNLSWLQILSYIDPISSATVIEPDRYKIETSGVTEYHQTDETFLAPPYNTNSLNLKLELRSTMSDSAFQSVKVAINEAITNIGSYGNDREAGLNSIGNILIDVGANRIFNVGDKAVMVIISDTNNNGNGDAVVRSDYNFTKGDSYVRYEVKFPNDRQATFEYPGANGNISTSAFVHMNPTLYSLPLTCPLAPRSCTSTLEDWLKSLFSLNIISNCQFSCETTGFMGQSETDQLPGNLARNWCLGAFTQNGTTYSDIYQYFKTVHYAQEAPIPGSCTRSVNENWTYAYSQRTLKESLSPGAQTLEEGIIQKSNALFGPQGYYYAAIIRDQQAENNLGVSCTSPLPEDYGVLYRNFINSIGAQGTVYPICAPDYSPVLNGISNFVNTVYMRTYSVLLAAGEKLLGASIRRGGVVIPIVTTDRTIIGNTIQIHSNVVLMPGDEIMISIQEP